MHKLEVVFIQGTSLTSKAISKISNMMYRGNQTSDFVPSHVLLMLDNKIIFESSTYKTDDTKTKTFEKGTRILLLNDIDDKHKNSLIKRTTISDDCDVYLALKYVAKASNYHYSYKSIFKFLTNGHLKKDNNKSKDEYICSGLVLDALREPVFNDNKSIQYIISKFKDINSNSVTPLDLFMAFNEAGFNFKETRGYSFVNNI